jgi:site-specific DNA-methyltransferase (adenine-specific)/site-specific DNA-methyltransferase (cytosine-N4-specific)
MSSWHIICGDSREIPLRFENQIDLIMTSPPYADARKKYYESIDPDKYPDWFASFHVALWQALKPTGSLVINIKDKIVDGVRHRYVWRTIDRLTSLGWQCIDDYVWVKKNSVPGYWPTRLRDGWEHCFHLAKTKRPFINQAAVRIPIAGSTKKRLNRLGENDRRLAYSITGSGFARNLSNWLNKDTVLPSNVLLLSTETKNRQHPAAFPITLPSFFIKLLSPANGIVMDPFAGSGTTGEAALRLGRHAILIDNNPNYCLVANQRLSNYHQKNNL